MDAHNLFFSQRGWKPTWRNNHNSTQKIYVKKQNVQPVVYFLKFISDSIFDDFKESFWLFVDGGKC